MHTRRGDKIRRAPGLTFLVALLLINLGACGLVPPAATETPPDAATASPASVPALSPPAPLPPPPAPEPPAPRPITIVAVGDLLMHLPVVDAARTSEGYDFRGVFADTAEYITAADLAIANLETTLAPGVRAFSGYPTFNSPPELARDARAAGFDVFLTANNHSMDSGVKGLLETLDHLDRYGMAHTGTYRSADERAVGGPAGGLIIPVAGMQIGILNYTYGTNGLPVPEPWLVNLLEPFDQVLADVAVLRPQVDLLIVAPHWGDEYAIKPSARQKEMALALLAAGADIVLGNHPHVLQPMEYRSVPQPDGTARGAAIVYSMGNFISNQSGLERETGAIFLFEVDPRAGVLSVSYIPTWVKKGRPDGSSFRVLPAPKLSAAADPTVTAADLEQLAAVMALTGERLGAPTP